MSFTLTTLGSTLVAAAIANGTPLGIAAIAIGSGDGTTLTPSSTTLIAEQYRSAPSSITTGTGTVNLGLVVPSTTGGFTIQEIALFDGSDNMIAYSAYPATVKPALGVGLAQMTLTITCVLTVSTTSAITIASLVDNNYGTYANSTGDVTVTPTGHNYVADMTVTGAARTQNLILATGTGQAAGDKILLLLTLPASAAIILNVRSLTSGGTLLQTITTDGVTLSGWAEFIYTGTAWKYVRSQFPA